MLHQSAGRDGWQSASRRYAQKARASAPAEGAPEVDRADAGVIWSTQGYGGPAQPSPSIALCLNGIPLDVVRRPLDTPIFFDARAVSALLHEFDGGDPRRQWT
jgi:hypothetical protein